MMKQALAYSLPIARSPFNFFKMLKNSGGKCRIVSAIFLWSAMLLSSKGESLTYQIDKTNINRLPFELVLSKYSANDETLFKISVHFSESSNKPALELVALNQNGLIVKCALDAALVNNRIANYEFAIGSNLEKDIRLLFTIQAKSSNGSKMPAFDRFECSLETLSKCLSKQ